MKNLRHGEVVPGEQPDPEIDGTVDRVDFVRTTQDGGGAQSPPAELPDQPAVHRVVWQLAESGIGRQERLLRQIVNLRTDLGLGEVLVEVVAHGDGLDLLVTPSRRADLVRDLQADGVTFVACENTMRARGLGSADLVEGVQMAPSGVGHLVRRQAAGWAYLRT
jgi:intracellular sulfur oxidation DsrE/DsrF family protein